ncbi:TlpA disulfide reductase family protein [Cytophaga sp. FL35]|uniref:TlpA disulfide reductase family protein n=1 Tax=Cytophaga sp. FL35 TaxID=1904456 RepID=UPI0016534AD5|nr:TlpA disulfide reductase family protein [Cytophaga sp. FL35]MBC6998882.1 TlpA family protein disulfide reductase [Cytophaga sp. FL35]
MKRKTVFTLLLIVFILSFFITPVGYWSKKKLMQVFAPSPEIISQEDRIHLQEYDWRLKDADWDYFNLRISEGKPLFIHFWASWHLPSSSELDDIQRLYDKYKGKVDFYIITNEEREPVQEFLGKNKYTFPITYRIVGEPAPVEILEPSGTYIIDTEGSILVKSLDSKDWYNDKIKEILDAIGN